MGTCSGKWLWMPVVTLSPRVSATGHMLSCEAYVTWAMNTQVGVTL